MENPNISEKYTKWKELACLKIIRINQIITVKNDDSLTALYFVVKEIALGLNYLTFTSIHRLIIHKVKIVSSNKYNFLKNKPKLSLY